MASNNDGLFMFMVGYNFLEVQKWSTVLISPDKYDYNHDIFKVIE